MSRYGLLFYFSDDFSEGDVALLEKLVDELASTTEWTDGPPAFIDEVDSSEDAIRTVGGFLPLSHPNDVEDHEIEKAYYQEVSSIVDALSSFSEKTGCEFELQLGEVYVGNIANGHPDESIKIGLLSEWQKRL